MNDLFILGDVFLDKIYKVDYAFENYILNLEYPITSIGEPARNKILLRADRSYLLETFRKNPLAVCLANNHIFDYGKEGVKSTLRHLSEEEIPFFGLGNPSNNYNNPFLLPFNQKTIALSAFTCPSTHPSRGDEGLDLPMVDRELISRTIQQSKEQADFVIVMFHWGCEEVKLPKLEDVSLAHFCIDQGVDLVLGHHSHTVQSKEIYKGKSIYYGLGNCIFPNLNAPSGYDGNCFSDPYIKKQRKRNRESLAIRIRKDLSLENQGFYFNGESLQAKQISPSKTIPLNELSFQRHLHRVRCKLMLENFISNPKLPSKRHLKSLLRGFS